MKPIAVFQNTHDDGPGQFEVFARERSLPIKIFRLYANDSLPPSLDEFNGLCILGSPRSVNDDLAEFRIMESLILEARRERVPVIGHCFGGQILSKALGGKVSRATHAEIGWSDIRAHAHTWFGAERFPMFQWHKEIFSVPRDATLLASSEHCPNQAFSVDEIHFGMQFHCEVDQAKIESWLDKQGKSEIAVSPSPGVQTPVEIRRLLPSRLATSKRVAATIYAQWAKALRA